MTSGHAAGTAEPGQDGPRVEHTAEHMAEHTPATASSRAGALALALSIGAFAFLLCVFPTRSMDAFWHLRTGELILEHGDLPRLDWYTYTDADRPWIDLHWGFQIALARLISIGGVDLAILAKAGVVAAAVLLLTILGRGSGPLSRFLALALVAVVASGHADLRPGVLSLLFLAAALTLVERSVSRPRLAFALVPLQVLWVNCQGLFALGLVVAGAHAADQVIRSLARGRFGISRLSSREASPRAAVFAACAAGLACLLNPYGLDGALFPLELLRKLSVDREAYAVILEFQRPIDFWRANGGGIDGLGVGFLLPQLLLFLAAAASFAIPLRNGEMRPFRVIVLVAFSGLAWQMLRNSGPFSIAAGAVLLGNLSANRGASAVPGTVETANDGTRVAATLLVALLAIAAVPAGWIARLSGDGRRLALGEAQAWFMHGPARFATREGFPKGAFVSHVGQAAVYIRYMDRDSRVFMDGRLEVATRETFDRFHQVARLMAQRDLGFEELVRLPDGTLPAVLLDSRFSRAEINGLLALPDRWRLVFADATGAVFLATPTAVRLGLPEADIEPLENPPLPV